jgi:ribonuclease P protein component
LVKQTLKNQCEIQRVLRKGKRTRTKHIDFLHCKDQDYKIAIVCGKRSISKAVHRNYFKRLNRALAAQNLAKHGGHYIMLGRHSLSAVTRDQMKQTINDAWNEFLKASRKHSA